MAPDRGSWQRFLTHRFVQEFIITASGGVAVFLVLRYFIKQLNFDPDADSKQRAQIESAAILRRLDGPDEKAVVDEALSRPRKQDLHLSQYEQAILQDLVFPEDIPVSFEDIGGLKDIIEELKESVIYPLTMPELYIQSSSLLSAPSGVLLYGPPGCGKTMLAKALAHESGACFINLHISTITEKWFGDSNKLVNAVFSLARKLEPTIVFIDEVDAVLGTRRTGEHEANSMVKAEFMTHWDGLASASTSGHPQRILVLGATNRIHDIDEAILRRMPKKFPVTLPDAAQRLKILKLILKDTKIDKANFDIDYLARISNGMSGSEIKEACREAAMVPVREAIQQQRQRGVRMSEMRTENVRGLRTDDFFGRSNTKKLKGSRVSMRKDENKEWNTEPSSPATDSDMEETDMKDAQEKVGSFV